MDNSVIEISKLVEKLNGGLLEERLWSSFLDRLNTCISSTSIVLYIYRSDSLTPIYAATAGALPSNDEYQNYLPLSSFVNIPDGQVMSVTDIVAEKDYINSDFYRVYLAPLGIHHILGVDIQVSDNVCVVLRMVRSKANGPYSAADRAICQLLVPHMRQAAKTLLRLDRLNALQETFEHAIDIFPFGLLVLDNCGTILEKNKRAEQLLDGSDGISVSQGKLVTQKKSATGHLHAIVKKIAESNSAVPALSTVVLVARDGGKGDLNLILHRSPARGHLAGDSKAAVFVLLRDPAQQALLSPKIIAKLFPFTTAESDLAAFLSNGDDISDAAKNLRISVNTARTQLYSMFQKVGVNRQSQLVGLILRNIVTLDYFGVA